MRKTISNINSLVFPLAELITSGKNSVYKSLDIAHRVVQSGIGNQSFEAMFKLTDYLSPDRVLDRLHKISYEAIRDLIKSFKYKIKIPKEVVLAMDFTDKVFYGDKNHPNVMGAKGGKYVRRYLESSIVDPALFLDAIPVNQLNNDKESLVTELIDAFYERFDKTKIGLLLLDRGFYAKKVVRMLVNKKISFVMPAVKNMRITRLVEKFKKNEIKERVRIKFGEVNVYLVFYKINDDVLVYLTNTRLNPFKVYNVYRKRWQIETNFREQNKFLFKTCTLNFNIRYLAFVIAGLLFNLWQMAKLKAKFELQNYIFKQILEDEIISNWITITKKKVIKKLDYFLLA